MTSRAATIKRRLGQSFEARGVRRSRRARPVMPRTDRHTLMARQTFRKHERIRSHEDYARVFEARCSASDDVLVVYVRPNGLGYTRLGIRVSRRVGKAVARVYVRRRIREAFRRNKSQVPAGFDLVCVPRAEAASRQVDMDRRLATLTAQAADRWEERSRRSRTRRSKSGRQG
jgi:ribonuclease P protein component